MKLILVNLVISNLTLFLVFYYKLVSEIINVREELIRKIASKMSEEVINELKSLKNFPNFF